MAYEPPVAVFDACILYPFHLRNLLVQCAVDRLIEARWTDEIHDEWIRNLVANNPGLSIPRLRQTRDLMKSVLPAADVTGYQQHIATITLPDPGDRHVVAAGIAAGASAIVTWNLRHFPAQELAKHGLIKQTPDALLMDLYGANPGVTVTTTASARRNLTKSGVAAPDFLKALDQQKLRRFAHAMQAHVSQI